MTHVHDISCNMHIWRPSVKMLRRCGDMLTSGYQNCQCYIHHCVSSVECHTNFATKCSKYVIWYSLFTETQSVDLKYTMPKHVASVYLNVRRTKLRYMKRNKVNNVLWYLYIICLKSVDSGRLPVDSRRPTAPNNVGFTPKQATAAEPRDGLEEEDGRRREPGSARSLADVFEICRPVNNAPLAESV